MPLWQLEHFFKFKIIGVNRGKNKVNGGTISKISLAQQIKHQSSCYN